MTDRYNALIVTLDEDVRSDDAEAIISAIRQLRHVAGVQPHVAAFSDTVARMRVRAELTAKLWDALKE